jgi:hypothetical protein
MSDEEILFNYEKSFSLKPAGLVFTNMRLICYRSKGFGGLELRDYSWRDLRNVRIKEGLLGGEIKFELGEDDEVEFENVPKDMLRKMYSLAKELKEKAHESSKRLIVHPETPEQPAVPQEDPVRKLKQLKEMLDAGLISQAEYDSKKVEILSKM